MLVVLYLVGAWCLVGVSADSGHRAMGRLQWCDPLCICNKQTNEEVQCFQRLQLLTLVGIPAWKGEYLEENEWYLEEKLFWCNDVCLCHKNSKKEFECTDEQSLVNFINDTIGDGYFYDTDVDEGEDEEQRQQAVTEDTLMMHHAVTEEIVVRSAETEEDREDTEHRRRSERRKNRRHRKQNRKRKGDAATTVGPTERDAETLPQPEPEPEPEFTPYQEPEPTPHQEPEPTPYQEPTEPTEPTSTSNSTTPSPYLLNRDETEAPWSGEQETAEPLPKQEAVAASPAITAMQPPTRRQPFPSTEEPYTPRVDNINPRAQPVLEVPKEKKTMASKVSQDLDELGSTVLEIQSHVVLNQRILFVTVALAGIAMLGYVTTVLQVRYIA